MMILVLIAGNHAGPDGANRLEGGDDVVNTGKNDQVQNEEETNANRDGLEDPRLQS